MDILVGFDYFADLFTREKITSESSSLTALHTIFGWTVSGRTTTPASTDVISHQVVFNCNNELNIDEQLRKFWEIEQVPAAPIHTPEAPELELHFKNTHTGDGSGQFIVKLINRRSPESVAPHGS